MPKWARISVAIAVAAAGLGALYHLLLLQYATGEVYPPYSSYRADPLGTRALYESLERIEGVAPRRNLTELRTAVLEPDGTLVLHAAPYGKDPVAILEKLEAYVARGNHLVILFEPHPFQAPIRVGPEEDPDDAPEAESEENEVSEDDADMLTVLNPVADIAERWGFGYGFKALPVDDEDIGQIEVRRAPGAPPHLPAALPWHSGMYFQRVSFDWNILYARNGTPVLIERRWEDGRVVVATDTYLISNEALLYDREPELLAWLFGARPTVIFDETHLGVQKRPGIMTLLIRYRLVPVLAVAVLLALLFIWRNAVSLVPRYERDRPAYESADTTVAGMANLTRRAVPPRALLATCWGVYQAPGAHRRPPHATAAASAAAIAGRDTTRRPRARDLVNAYNRIAQLVNERNTKR